MQIATRFVTGSAVKSVPSSVVLSVVVRRILYFRADAPHQHLSPTSMIRGSG